MRKGEHTGRRSYYNNRRSAVCEHALRVSRRVALQLYTVTAVQEKNKGMYEHTLLPNPKNKTYQVAMSPFGISKHETSIYMSCGYETWRLRYNSQSATR
jgi:hypothetical protein